MSTPSLPSARALFSLLGLALLALSLAGCSRQSAAPPGGSPEVTVVTLSAERVELTRELPGRTTAFAIAQIRPQVNGLIRQRLFEEGGNVEAGQALYAIEDATYAADHHSAQAALARAQAAHELARLQAARTAQLVAAGAVSEQEGDQAAAALRQAAAEERVAAAAVERSEVALGYTRVTSPISGRIGKSAVTAGALVTANQEEPLAVVQQLDPLYVDVTLSSREWLEIRHELDAGRADRAEIPVELLLEDGTRYAHAGKFEFSEATVDPATGAMAARITAPNPGHLLLPGMFVRAVIGTATRAQAVLAPQQAVARDPRGNTSALVVNAQGIVEFRPVRVARTVGSKWLVEEGLAAGDRVIVEGLQKIRPGMPVRAVEAGVATSPASARP